jgi:hypothetical protein
MKKIALNERGARWGGGSCDVADVTVKRYSAETKQRFAGERFRYRTSGRGRNNREQGEVVAVGEGRFGLGHEVRKK